MENKVCPICEDGVLTLKEGVNETVHKGVKGAVRFFYEECDACGSEQADAHLSLKNKRLMLAFRKQAEGLLTGDEVRAIREHLNLTQSVAARIFGGGPTAFSKYESDDVAQSVAMDKLLRVADAVPQAFRYLCDLAGHDAPAARPKLSVVAAGAKARWRTVQPPANPAALVARWSRPLERHVISDEPEYA